MPHLNINGANLFYQESGHGVPVVLLHGFPLDHRVWRHQAHDLSGMCRIITPDFRGFGHSHNNATFTIQSLAEDIYVLLSQLRALPCVLGGLSMGGYVALAYERAYASTLRGLMLVDSRASGDSPEAKAGRNTMTELAKTSGSSAITQAMMPKLLAPGSIESHPELVTELKTIMDNCPSQTIEHALAAMRDRADMRSTLTRIAAPTMILVGESDALVSNSEAEEMHKSIPGSTLNIIPSAGHMAVMEQPQQVARAIRHFIATLAA